MTHPGTGLIKNLIERSVIESRVQNANQRRIDLEKSTDFYEKNQIGYIKKFFDEEDWKISPFFNSELVKHVVDTLAQVYDKFPLRSLVNKNGEPVDGKDDGIQLLFSDEPQLNVGIKKGEKYANLLGNTVVRFADFSGAKLAHIETDYIPVFPETEDGYIISKTYPVGYHFPLQQDENSKNVSRDAYLFISDEHYFFHDTHGNRWPDKNFPAEKNPYGIMPLVDLSKPTPDSYWGSGLVSIVELCEAFLTGIMNSLHGQRLMSNGQPWVRGWPTHNLPMNTSDERIIKVGKFVWDLGDEGQAGNIDFAPKLAESLEFFRGLLNLELGFYGLKANLKESGSPMSGFAIVVSNRELLERRRSDITDIYIIQERRLFKVIQGMNKFHTWGYNIPETAKMITDFAEPEFPMEPEQERQQAEWEWKHGLSTREDFLIEKNPDLDKEAAEKLIEENMLKNRATRGLFNAENTNGALSNESI